MNQTLTYYAKNAATYSKLAPSKSRMAERAKFIETLPAGANLLEIGCGAGHDALFFMDKGFNVVAHDGCAEFGEITKERTGLEVVICDFEELDFTAAFDAIWASAALLHVSSDKLDLVVSKLYRALRPGGMISASFKAKDEDIGKDWEDGLGRHFCGVDEERIRNVFSNSGFTVERLETSAGFGTDNKPTQWLWIDGRK